MGSSFIAQSMLLLTVPLYAVQLGATPSTVGMLVSSQFWLPLLLAIALGRLISAFGAKRVMIGGAIGMILAPWLTVLFQGIPGLFATQLLIGVSQVSMGLSAQSSIALLGRGKAIENYFGWYTTSVSVGQLLGPLVAGVMIAKLGALDVFPVIGLIPILSLVLVGLLRGPAAAPQAPTTAVGVRASLGYLIQVRLLRSDVAVQMSLLVTVAILFAVASHASFFPIYLEGMGVPAALIGVLASLRAFSSTAIRPFMARIVSLLGGRSRTVLTCVLLALLGIGGTGLASGLLNLGLLAALVGVAAGLAVPLTMVTIAAHVPVEHRSGAFGMRLSVNQGTQLVAPLVLGFVAEIFGIGTMFVIAGGILLLLMFLVLRLVPSFDSMESELTV